MSQSRSNYTPRPMSNNTTYALGAVALVLIVLLVVLAFRWTRDDQSVRNDGYGPVRDAGVVAVLEADGAVLLGKPDARNTLEIYEDPLCPACGTLETVYGQEIAQKMDEGALAVRYRYVNFLDAKSGSKDYSTRAIAANECVAEAGDGPVYSKFHEALFGDKQPSEGGSDLTNQDLATLAADSGAPDAVISCITTGTKLDAAKTHAEAALEALTARMDGRAATPAVFDGDTKVDVNNHEWVVEASN
ncbi:DsbA family protein [Nocardia puris]|uniref:DsbA family protein n=1 Tax=Nocardia puris TaxID=208602 RepID=UPI002B4B5B4E|nr:thioredoxin domain-containing protein [Nocardia puris]